MANETPLTLIGNITKDPELAFTESGAARASFTVASTARTYDKASGQWSDGEVMFLDCTAWRNLAENIAETLTKGSRVVVTGRLKQRHWQTPEGEKRSRFALEVDEIGPSLRFVTATVHKTSKQTGSAADASAPTVTSEPPF